MRYRYKKSVLVPSLIVVVFTWASYMPVWSWSTTPIPDGLHIRDYACSEDESIQFLALYRAGFWRSTDGGTSWEPINSIIIENPAKIVKALEVNVVDANADTVVCKMSIEGEYWAQFSMYAVSTDGGDNWTLIDPEDANDANHSQHMLVDNRNSLNLYFLNLRSMAASNDFGSSWDTWVYDDFFIGHAMDFFSQDFVDPDLFYSGPLAISESDLVTIWKSEDRGHNWSPCFDPDTLVQGYSLIADALPLSNGDVIAIGTHDGDPNSEELRRQARMFTYNDETGVWGQELLPIPTTQFPVELICNQENENHLLLSTRDEDIVQHGLWESRDQGESWLNNPPDLPEKLTGVRPIDSRGGNGLYLGTAGYGLFEWNTEVGLWQSKPVALDVGRGLLFNIGPDYIIAQGQYDRRIQLYRFETMQWDDIPLSSETDDIVLPIPLLLEDDDRWISMRTRVANDSSVHDQTDVLESFDQGSSWSVVSTFDSPGFPMAIMPKSSPSVFHRDSSAVIALVRRSLRDEGGPVSVSTDSGRTWQHHDFGSGVFSASFALADNRLYAACFDVGVYYSDDWGATWQDMQFPNPMDISILNNDQIFIDEHTGRVVVIGFEHIYRYDGEWEQLRYIQRPFQDNTEIPGDPPAIICLDRSEDWFSIHKLMISYDFGDTWEQLDLDIPYREQFTDMFQIEYDPWRHRVWLSTPLGLVYLDADELAVADPGAKVEALPLDYELLTSWPNPFNDQATVRYHVLRPGPIELDLYDLQGRLVRHLVDNSGVRAGSHELTLDGKGLASGSYFLRLTMADRDPITHKIVLLR